MAEPRIQYAKTSDGLSIAYCTLGEGTPTSIPQAIAIAVRRAILLRKYAPRSY